MNQQPISINDSIIGLIVNDAMATCVDFEGRGLLGQFYTEKSDCDEYDHMLHEDKCSVGMHAMRVYLKGKIRKLVYGIRPMLDPDTFKPAIEVTMLDGEIDGEGVLGLSEFSIKNPAVLSDVDMFLMGNKVCVTASEMRFSADLLPTVHTPDAIRNKFNQEQLTDEDVADIIMTVATALKKPYDTVESGEGGQGDV